ncbi:hypothetical protein OPU71_05595 [Niveibacterium sp. 24ML]|uniref:GlsB/YeaQ/YmgE family stress response membrane protein n=1 Tax=Niveibacterium sp. 24ML TaxID=2985512 RepID=UPI0022708171|nr:hypothetical protein [Niveibacterium sp. 24ML]MCX9155595.1 hypothetical protein [Niveibacterium sp. 24ML]
MSLIGWIVIGLLIGFFASMRMRRSERSTLIDIGVGTVGAVTGGSVITSFGHSDIAGINLPSQLLAIVGATALLLAYHAVFRVAR